MKKGAMTPEQILAADAEFHAKNPKARHGSSKHRGARVQKYVAANRKKKAKRKRSR